MLRKNRSKKCGTSTTRQEIEAMRPELLKVLQIAIEETGKSVRKVIEEKPENEEAARKLFNRYAAASIDMINECLTRYPKDSFPVPVFKFYGKLWPANEVPD